MRNMSKVYDYVNKIIRRLRGDSSGRAITLPEGQYLATLPSLSDEDYSHLMLTDDGKLIVNLDPYHDVKPASDGGYVLGDDLLRWASLSLYPHTSDPALYEGRFWFRGDLDLLRYTPDGATARSLPYGSIDVDAHASRHAIGGADTLDGSFSKVVWKDASEQALSDLNRTSSLSATDLDLTAYTSSDAKLVILTVTVVVDTIGSGSNCVVGVRKNGTTPAAAPQNKVMKDGVTTGVPIPVEVIIAMDTDEIIEYWITIGTGWQIDTYINVLGYIE